MPWKPNKASSKILFASQRILNEYDYPITFKQLYYRLIEEGVMENTLASYRKLNTLITNARKHGRLSPALFTSGVPLPKEGQTVEGYLEECVQNYRIDRTTNQKNYVEVWVESETMYGFMQCLLKPYDVPVFVSQGYSSYPFTYQAYRRLAAAVLRGQVPRVLYFSDLSVPSLNMFESLVNEMASQFDMSHAEAASMIFPVAVLPDHVVKYDLPVSPEEAKDSRAKLFEEKYGDILESIGLSRRVKVELEAIDPKNLRSLLFNAVFSILDYNVMREVEKQEARDKAKLRTIIGLE